MDLEGWIILALVAVVIAAVTWKRSGGGADAAPMCPLADQAELEAAIRALVRSRFDVGDRTDEYAFLVRRPEFSIPLAIVLAVTVVGLIAYILVWACQEDEFVELRVGEVPSFS